MFVIALRLIGSGAPSTATREPVPVVNAALQLTVGDDDRWCVVAKGEGHGKIYDSISEAQEDYKDIANAVFSKEHFVAPVTQVISAFIDQYLHRERRYAYQAFFEIQALNPITIDEQAIDLEMF